jgi:hypothetical protein
MLVDDAAFSPGLSSVTPAGFTFDDVAPDSVNEGDIGAARMSANRNIYATIRDAAGNERGVNVNASGEMSVAPHNVTNAGTFPVQATGEVAHDAVDTGNPQKVGGVARQTLQAAVADGDRVNATFDDLGRQVVCINSPRDMVVQTRTSLNSTAETVIIAALAATYFDLTMLVFSHEGTTNDIRIDIRDSSAGTIRLSVDLAPDGGGAVIPFNTPFKQGGVNNNWTAQLSAAPTSGNVYITVQAIGNN